MTHEGSQYFEMGEPDSDDTISILSVRRILYDYAQTFGIELRMKNTYPAISAYTLKRSRKFSTQHYRRSIHGLSSQWTPTMAFQLQKQSSRAVKSLNNRQKCYHPLMKKGLFQWIWQSVFSMHYTLRMVKSHSRIFAFSQCRGFTNTQSEDLVASGLIEAYSTPSKKQQH